MNYKGQGALEYLLLLVAAMFVVAIVFVFINSTIEPTKDTGSERTYSFLCGDLDSNTADCACYNGNTNKYFDITDADSDGKSDKAEIYCCTEQDDAYLEEKFGC